MISPRVRAMVAEKPVEWVANRRDVHGNTFTLHATMVEIAYGWWDVSYDGEHQYFTGDAEAAALIAWAWMERLRASDGVVSITAASGQWNIYVHPDKVFTAPSLLDALAEAIEQTNIKE